MKQSNNGKQNFTPSEKRAVVIVASLLSVGAIVVLVLLVILLRQRAGLQSQPAPTPQCIEPTLTLGTTNFHVKTIPNSPNAFPVLPLDTSDSAYWVGGTTVNYVFGLSPVGNNLTLNTSLKAGDPMVINWGDCSKDEYVVNSVDMGQPNDLKIFDQSQGGVTVYVQTGASNLVIRGVHPAIQSAETAQPEPTSQYQIDVAFSDQPSTDPQTVKIGLTITNKGTQAITLNNNDISLTAENGPEIFPLIIEPPLAQQIGPGNSIQIVVTFPKPPANSAVLRILNLTLDYYF